MRCSRADTACVTTALLLFHDLDASAMVLVWTLGTTVLIVGLGGIIGRSLCAPTLPRGLEG